MADEPQGLSVTLPPAPTKGADVLSWASGLVKWLGREMPSFGQGFSTAYQPGKMVTAARQNLPDAFRVYKVNKTTISIRGGYAQTQTGTLTAAASVASVAVSADLAVFARYDLGLAGTSTPGWEVVSGSIIQTAAALPTYDARYRVVPIASATFDGTSSRITEILQHHTGLIECPDMIQAGTVAYFTGATVPHGWKLHTASERRVIVGYKSGDDDYGTITATGGTDSHTIDLGHRHELRSQTSGPGPIGSATSCYHFDTAETACSDNSAEWCDANINDATGEITLDNRQLWYVLARMEHL